MLPITYQNGNISVTLDKDGTKTLEYDGELKPKFPISLDFKITQFCDGAFCEFCHEKSTPKGNHGDLGKAISWFKSMPCAEIACGGGDPLSHPDLIWFLKELKSLGMVPNLTINQKHLQMRKNVIDQILKEDLVYGLGLSFWKIDEELKDFCKEKKDLIIHLISGIHPVSVIDEIKEFHNKVLVLGYKDYGFGKAHKVKHSAEVSQSLEQWSWGIGSRLKDIQISFDNLAVDQLDMKRFFNANIWQERFLGEDGTLTFYVDAVKQQWAKNSTSPDRFTMEGETIETAFRKLIS